MRIKLREVGGRNNGRILTFTSQAQFDTALRNVVRSRFLVAKPIEVDTQEDGTQSCSVVIGPDKVQFAEVKYEDKEVDSGW